jgi:hypothetical protein
MRKKLIIVVCATLAVAGIGLFMFWPFFQPVPTPEQVAGQIKEAEEAKLRREADEDAKLAAIDSLPNLTVAEIARTPARYDKRLVRLRGCVFLGFETSALMDCESPWGNSQDRIWLESSVEYILATEKAFGKKEHWRVPLPQTESQVALKKQVLTTRYARTPVMVDGEFQSSQGAYGHLSAYKYRLILHRVIQVSAPIIVTNAGPKK